MSRTDLATVDKELFNRVWDLVKELDDREKHFNDLQSRYRTLASTWLLAAFAGCGFVFSKALTAPVSSHLIAIFIALAGACGIMLLWVLDVVVYHDLLIAGYVAGRRLEETFEWLPPVRRTFDKLREGPVRWYIANFYIVGITILLLIAAVTCWFWRGGYSHYLLAIIVLGILLDGLIVLCTRAALERKARLKPWQPIILPPASGPPSKGGSAHP